MNCRTARQTLELARPDEIEPKGLDDAARHLEECPACQSAVRRQDGLDWRIGVLCRDVRVPSGLKERLMEELAAGAQPRPELAGRGGQIGPEASAEPAHVSPVAAVVIPVAKTATRMTRRRWAVVASTVAAAVVASAGWSALWLLASKPTVNLDAVTQRLTNGLDPNELGAFTQFDDGAWAKLPETMDTRDVAPEPRRLPGGQIAARTDVAVYFFTLSDPRRATYQGRLAVVPKGCVMNPPKETRFGESAVYRGAVVTSTWIEGKFVYVCCLDSAHSLERLRPRNSAI